MENRRFLPGQATLLVALFTFAGTKAQAHEGRGYEPAEKPLKPMEEPLDQQERRMVEITADYQLMVAPLFQKACADCHSGDTDYPWYAMVPGIKQMIRRDIEEARKHIEFSNGYPFQSHATPLEDLIAVEKVIKDDSMPPLRYRLMHSSARLDELEKKRILTWARRGQQLLREDMARASQ